MPTKTKPRVYVGTYAKYNSGNLKGKWLDLSKYGSKDEFLEACRRLHKDERDPELMFQDREGIPEGMISESSISDDLWDWMNMSDDDRQLLHMYRTFVDSSSKTGTLERAQDAFMGVFDSEEDWAEDYLKEAGYLDQVPEVLQGYIDFAKYAQDANFNGMRFEQDEHGKTWVFQPL
jgi:antirestriction protein